MMPKAFMVLLARAAFVGLAHATCNGDDTMYIFDNRHAVGTRSRCSKYVWGNTVSCHVDRFTKGYDDKSDNSKCQLCKGETFATWWNYPCTPHATELNLAR